MTSFFDKIKNKLLSRFNPNNLNTLTDAVSKKLGEARQKLLTSDSSLKVIARTCIDDAEDSYQEAIYALKDGSLEEALAYCKKSLSFLSLATLHLSSSTNLHREPEFKGGSCEDVILTLAKAIAQFKSVIEYTNCDLSKEEHDRYMEVVRLFYKATDVFSDDQEKRASRIAFSGLLWIYLLSGYIEERTNSIVIGDQYFREFGDTDIERIVDLVDSTFQVRKEFLDASEPAKLRTNQYLLAAQSTIEQSIFDYMEEVSVAKLVKAGKMEIRMAKRLLESSFSPDEEPQVIPEQEDYHKRSHEFKMRVAYLQQLIRDNDPESLKLVRRLHQVSSYYARAVRLKEEGSLSEAERYARSAHLDIDYARQLFSKGVAFFSDTI